MNLRVRPCRNLRGSATIPGDKSISHRALVLGAIAQGVSHVQGWLPAGVCQAMLDAVRALGVNGRAAGADGADHPRRRAARPAPAGRAD